MLFTFGAIMLAVACMIWSGLASQRLKTAQANCFMGGKIGIWKILLQIQFLGALVLHQPAKIDGSAPLQRSTIPLQHLPLKDAGQYQQPIFASGALAGPMSYLETESRPTDGVV